MTTTIAQTKTSSPVGEYYLRGVMETASGFKLNEDSSFEFFFSYGALDRMGQGHWGMENNKLVLNSPQKLGPDFALVSSKKTTDGKITVRVVESTEIFLRSVYCIITGGGRKQEVLLDKYGNASFDQQSIDSIELLFEFCPEKTTVFKPQEANDNHFEFRFEPWMMEVFFTQFHLGYESTQLTGAHPLLKGETFTYKKAGSGN